MKKAVDIFESLSFHAFTMKLGENFLVTIQGNQGRETPRPVRHWLKQYSRESIKTALLAIRNRVAEGALLLTPAEGRYEINGTTEVIWKFDAEANEVTGVLRYMPEGCGYINQCETLHRLQAVVAEAESISKANHRPKANHLHHLSPFHSLPEKETNTDRLVQLRVALDGANLGFWDWNPTSDILVVNQHWAQMIGYRFDQIHSGQFFFDRIHPDDQSLVQAALSAYKQGKTQLYRCRFRLKHADGHYEHIEASGAYQRRKCINGEINYHLVGIHRNRTEEVLKQKQLERALLQAEEASKAKSMFLASVSHEIRTPVHAVQNLIELAKTYHTVPEQLNFLNSAVDTISGLSYMLNGLVDFAYMEETQLIPEVGKVRLHTLMRTCQAYFQSKADEKGLGFAVKLDPKLQVIHESDEKMLMEILLALAGNAIKFTQFGNIKVTANLLNRIERVDKSGQFNDRIELKVQDTGLGMDLATVEKNFNGFDAKDFARNREEGGIGIGLKLVHGYVKALGGTVKVESEPGFGTTVLIELTLKGIPAEHLDNSFPIELGSTGNGSIKRVMIVDDVSTNRMILRTQLERAGLQVIEANDGQEALNFFALDEFECDLILMDVQMPVMDGITCTKILREDMCIGTPIVGVTADATRETERDALRAGMNELLFKPIDVLRIVAAINARNSLFETIQRI